MERKPVHAGVMLNEKGDVALVRRKKVEKGEGGVVLEWSLPCGKPNPGEDGFQCVERETYKETGYKNYATQCIGEADHPEFPVHIFYYLCYPVDPFQEARIIEKRSIVEMKCVPKNEVLQYIKTSLANCVAEKLGLVGDNPAPAAPTTPRTW